MQMQAGNIIPAVVGATLILSFIGWGAQADPAPLGQPLGEPLLVVEGAITVTNADQKAVFDLEMLETLGTRTVTTTTPWYTGEVVFEGVPVSAVMSAVGATGETVVAIALNDYKAEIPISDFEAHGVILALKRNGDYMPISDKGPIFIVYPYDQSAELHTQKYYGRSVWQLSRMVVE